MNKKIVLVSLLLLSALVVVGFANYRGYWSYYSNRKKLTQTELSVSTGKPIPKYDRAVRMRLLKELIVFAEKNAFTLSLSGAQLQDCDFNYLFRDLSLPPGTNLEGANVDRTQIYEVDLEGLIARNSSFVGGSLSGAKLGFTDLSGSTFLHARMDRTDLSNSKLVGVVFDKVMMPKVIFENSDLTGSRFNRTKIFMAKLSGANLTKVDFSKAWLGSADFRRTNLTGILFGNMELEGRYNFLDAHWTGQHPALWNALSAEQRMQVIAPDESGWSLEDHMEQHLKDENQSSGDCIYEELYNGN